MSVENNKTTFAYDLNAEIEPRVFSALGGAGQ